MENKDYCFKCGEQAEYEIEFKVGEGESIDTKNICESCLIKSHCCYGARRRGERRTNHE